MGRLSKDLLASEPRRRADKRRGRKEGTGDGAAFDVAGAATGGQNRQGVKMRGAQGQGVRFILGWGRVG